MRPGPGAVSAIENESIRILNERVDLSHLGAGSRTVTERVIHASADLEYAKTMAISEEAVQLGVEALRRGSPVLTDVEMLRQAITETDSRCFIAAPEASKMSETSDLTRSAAGIRLAARHHREGAIFAIGCAPTALFELLDLADRRHVSPALVVGIPVGFVGAAQAKAALRASGLASISNTGEKGGSAVTAAVVNALCRIAGQR